MSILRLKCMSFLLCLICLLAGAPGWGQVFGEPAMVDTIRSISPDLATFSGSGGDIPVFESVDEDSLFEPPIHLVDVEAAENVVTFGKGQFGSGWCWPCGAVEDQRFHLGVDLAVHSAATDDVINVYSMSDGEVVLNQADSAGWGCHIVVRHELSQGEEYPFEIVTGWQDVSGNRLIVQDGELRKEGGDVLGPDESVYPRSSHVERFRPGGERPYLYLYIDYQHIVPLDSTREDCEIDREITKGQILGTIDPETDPPHVHIHARYAASMNADELHRELMASTAVYKRQDIFSNGELVRKAITRYRVRAVDYQGTMPVVNPLRLTYLSQPNNVPVPFRDVPGTEWYAEYVIGAWEGGVISGVGESGFFEPTRSINFAEFFKMLVLASEIDLRSCVDGENPVPSFANLFPSYSVAERDPWFCPFYKTAAEEGWLAPFLALRRNNEPLRGIPADPILRQEVAFFLARFLPLEGPVGAGFPDVDVDNPFRTAIRRVQGAEIMEGDGEGQFNPTQEIIRAEIVKVLELRFNRERYGSAPAERP